MISIAHRNVTMTTMAMAMTATMMTTWRMVTMGAAAVDVFGRESDHVGCWPAASDWFRGDFTIAGPNLVGELFESHEP